MAHCPAQEEQPIITATEESQDKKDLRDEILKTGLRLFVEQGYFNTSVADIKRAAGVSTGSIYHYFSNKEAIAQALYADLLSSLDQSLEAICRDHASAVERMRAVVELLFRLTEMAPDVMRFLFTINQQEFLPAEKPLVYSAPFKKLRKIITLGMDAGEIRRMDAVLAYGCFYGAVFHCIQMHLDGLLEQSLDDCVDDIWRTSWRMIDAL